MPDRNDDKTPEQPSKDAAPAAVPPSPEGQPSSVAQSDAPTEAIPKQTAAPTPPAGSAETPTEAIPIAPKQMTVRPVPARPGPLPVPPPPRAPAPRRVEPAEPPAQVSAPPAPPEQPATEAMSIVKQPEPEPEPVPPPVEAAMPKPPPPPVAKPQRVLPTEPPAPTKKKRGKWLAALLAAIVAVAAVAVAIVLVSKTKDTGPTADDQIRGTINDFAKALTAGDIQKLRTTSCGPLSDYYRNIPDTQFADIYKASVEQKNIPVIQSIDAIQVTDKTAIAQVTAYTNADPATKSARTFNLENTDQGWKVCDPPT